jgi:PIN domain nuclease of toxin-antitoxin system
LNFLLDTNVFVFMLREPERISEPAIAAIQNPDSQLFLSAVSCWEMMQKLSAGKLAWTSAGQSITALRERLRVLELPFDERAAQRLSELPDHHRDPFDRMLVCQAIETGMPILSSDRALRHYPVRVVW